MRRLLVLVVLACSSSGCMRNAITLVDAQNWNRLKPKLPTVAPDIVELHYIFIEREAGNPEINESIWAEADEQAVSLDLKNTLQSNGLRVGKLGGTLSPELLKLLENSNARGEGRRHQTRSGLVAKVQMTEVLPHWNLFTVVGNSPRGEEITLGQGYFHLIPTLGDGNSVHLSLVPELEYGERQNRKTPAPDLSGWQIRTERDSRSYPELKVNLSIESGEYALVGCWPGRNGTLGNYYFNKVVDGRKMQTVLLIRAVRPTREELYTAGYDFDDFFLTPMGEPQSDNRSVVHETVLADSQHP